MLRPARPLSVTQVLLSLRRIAESEAQSRLRAARSALEVARLAEQAAVQKRQRLTQQLTELRQESREIGLLCGDLLSRRALSIASTHKALRDAQRDEAARGQQCSELRHEVEELQRHLRLCVARREAAALHESAERREQRRQRERRERAMEEDARDRVLSASRPGLRR